MTRPAWLIEFHRRWLKARRSRPRASRRAYGLDWDKLLEDSGITSVEDQKTAVREAVVLEKAGHLKLKCHPYRQYIIKRLILPLDSEEWFGRLFDSEDSASLLRRSLGAIDAQAEHPLYPEMWVSFLGKLYRDIRDGRSPRPFSWSKPERLELYLSVLLGLSSREWEAGTLVRAASVELGLDSKFLERRQRSLASALTSFFGIPTTLSDLGLIMSESMLWTQGPLVLHFADGKSFDYEGLGVHAISFADLDRATLIECPCLYLLTIENAKTTFRQFAAVNHDGRTLLVASSFPTPALRALLSKLPGEIEHYHFGDSDATGFLILSKIREASPGFVSRFHMRFGRGVIDRPISERDFKILNKMQLDDLMCDCEEDFNAMTFTLSMGDFEQESLGPPTRDGWPFIEPDFGH